MPNDLAAAFSERPDDYAGPGRPTDYRPVFAKLAGKMAKLGALDADIADALGVTTRSIERWRASIPEFSRAIKTEQQGATEHVVRSLFHRACGYTYQIRKAFFDKDSGNVVQGIEDVHVPPDTGAAAFWLKNKRPGEWRDRREIDISGSVDITIAIDLTPPAPRDITAQVVKIANLPDVQSV
mgnify:CR=1 FL=1